jgi:hypothetical protein
MDDHIKEIDLDKEAKRKLQNIKKVRRFHQKNKDNPEYKKMKADNQKKAYHNNPEYRQRKLDAYKNNKELHNKRTLYNKYKRENRLNLFIERHPDKYEFLIKHDRKRYEVKSEPTEPHDPGLAVAPE